MDDVLEFLGLEHLALDDYRPANQAVASWTANLFRGVGAVPGIKLIPSSWRESVKEAIRRRAAIENPSLPEHVIRLLRDHYRPHNQRLAELTGRNLDHWS